MEKTCRYATMTLLDNHTIFVKSNKCDRTFTIKDDNEIVSMSFDVNRLYQYDKDFHLNETNDFIVCYTTKLADGKYQHCRYYFDRTTLELTFTYKAKPYNKKEGV